MVRSSSEIPISNQPDYMSPVRRLSKADQNFPAADKRVAGMADPLGELKLKFSQIEQEIKNLIDAHRVSDLSDIKKGDARFTEDIVNLADQLKADLRSTALKIVELEGTIGHDIGVYGKFPDMPPPPPPSTKKPLSKKELAQHAREEKIAQLESDLRFAINVRETSNIPDIIEQEIAKITAELKALKPDFTLEQKPPELPHEEVVLSLVRAYEPKQAATVNDPHEEIMAKMEAAKAKDTPTPKPEGRLSRLFARVRKWRRNPVPPEV